jgi:hypothetical protein
MVADDHRTNNARLATNVNVITNDGTARSGPCSDCTSMV